MSELSQFFNKLADTSDWPARWKCGTWSEFHGWLYIVSDLMIWAAYFAIPLVILRFVQKKKNILFSPLYFLFALFILACGLTHLISAITFWIPAYRLGALILFVTGLLSWATVFCLIKYLPAAFLMPSQKELESEIERRKKAEKELNIVNNTLDLIVAERTSEINHYKYALDESCIFAITDENARLKSVNDYYSKITGFAKEELIGGDITKSFADFHTPASIKNILNELSEGKTWRGDLCCKNKEDNCIYVATTIVPLHNKFNDSSQYLFISFDITERYQAEQDLLDKTKQLGDVLEQITDGFISLDADFRYTYVNKRLGEMVSRSPASLIGKCVWDEFPDAVDSLTYKTFKKALKEQIYVLSQDYYPPLDLWQENHIYPSNDGLFVFIRDISKQKKAELKIKESEERFRKLIEHNEDIITLLDRNFKPLYRSPSADKITGKTFNEVVNEDRSFDIHPDDLSSLMSTFQEVLQYNGCSLPLCFRTKHKSGNYIWLEGSITNMLEDESIHALVINLKDVSHRKEVEDQLTQSERIYKTIASSIPGSVICIMDLDYRYLLIEGDMLEKIGYRKSSLQGKRMEEVIVPEIFNEWNNYFDKVLKGESVIKETMYNGLDVHTRIVPLKDQANNIYAIMTVGLDVTELKKAQREVSMLNHDLELKVSQRTNQLESANMELEAFSYSVSHDLRAPLRSINGYSKMLEEDYSQLFDANGLRILHTIQRNARRMGLLIDDLLSFSRLGRLEVKKSLINMNALVKATITELIDLQPSKAIITVNKLHPARADMALIKQVVINYLSNALKYSGKKNEQHISVRSEIKDNMVIYSFNDNGTGFNMDYASKLFGVFQRLHSLEDFEGTGVGLAIVKRIVEKHGGKVWADGKVDQGATFYFSLPVDLEELPEK